MYFRLSIDTDRVSVAFPFSTPKQKWGWLIVLSVIIYLKSHSSDASVRNYGCKPSRARVVRQPGWSCPTLPSTFSVISVRPSLFALSHGSFWSPDVAYLSPPGVGQDLTFFNSPDAIFFHTIRSSSLCCLFKFSNRHLSHSRILVVYFTSFQ